MKKWHMEGILRMESRLSGKLQIPRPGQRTLFNGAYDQPVENEFFLMKMVRAVRDKVQRPV